MGKADRAKRANKADRTDRREGDWTDWTNWTNWRGGIVVLSGGMAGFEGLIVCGGVVSPRVGLCGDDMMVLATRPSAPTELLDGPTLVAPALQALATTQPMVNVVGLWVGG